MGWGGLDGDWIGVNSFMDDLKRPNLKWGPSNLENFLVILRVALFVGLRWNWEQVAISLDNDQRVRASYKINPFLSQNFQTGNFKKFSINTSNSLNIFQTVFYRRDYFRVFQSHIEKEVKNFFAVS